MNPHMTIESAIAKVERGQRAEGEPQHHLVSLHTVLALGLDSVVDDGCDEEERVERQPFDDLPSPPASNTASSPTTLVSDCTYDEMTLMSAGMGEAETHHRTIDYYIFGSNVEMHWPVRTNESSVFLARREIGRKQDIC